MALCEQPGGHIFHRRSGAQRNEDSAAEAQCEGGIGADHGQRPARADLMLAATGDAEVESENADHQHGEAGPQPGLGHAILFSCPMRSEEHTSELQSLMRISYAVFCLKKKNKNYRQNCY